MQPTPVFLPRERVPRTGAWLAAVLAVSERSDLACLHASPLLQQSPTFLAPGADFVENNFPVDGVGMVSG